MPLQYAACAYNEPPGSRIPMMEYFVGLGLNINAIDVLMMVPGDPYQNFMRGTLLDYAFNAGQKEEMIWLTAREEWQREWIILPESLGLSTFLRATPDMEWQGRSPVNRRRVWICCW